VQVASRLTIDAAGAGRAVGSDSPPSRLCATPQAAATASNAVSSRAVPEAAGLTRPTSQRAAITAIQIAMVTQKTVTAARLMIPRCPDASADRVFGRSQDFVEEIITFGDGLQPIRQP